MPVLLRVDLSTTAKSKQRALAVVFQVVLARSQPWHMFLLPHGWPAAKFYKGVNGTSWHLKMTSLVIV